MASALEIPTSPLNQSDPKPMNAVVRTKYGPPDVLEYKGIERPTPTEGRVLVRVYAASANPIDWHEMRGKPMILRLQSGLRKPKDQRLGTDIAGRVESVGQGATQFKAGDEVFGMCGGGFAEYA